MTGPRNRKAFNRSLERREQIRETWQRLCADFPYDRPTAVDVHRDLPFRMSVRRVREHLAALRADFDRAKAAEADANRPPP
jgi:hypothetical protein